MQAIKIQKHYTQYVLYGLLLLAQWVSAEITDNQLIIDAKNQQQKLIDTYGLLDYAQWSETCNTLIQQMSLTHFHQCLIVNTDYPNAYSLAHGVVMLTKGLLENISNDDQLAHVLAHEHAHLTLKHHQQAQAMVMNPPKLFTKSRIKKFYRSIEREADDEADKVLLQQNFDPKQIHHYLMRIEKLIKESSADHEKLKDRIRRNNLPQELIEKHWNQKSR